MNTVNLVNQENGNIRYDIQRYPDGQQSIEFNMDDLNSIRNQEVTILARISSFRDMEILISSNYALKNEGFDTVHLIMPYFLGGRSDRKFSDGGINYIKQVISPILNSLNFKTVTVFHPHSDVIEACINNIVIVNNDFLVSYALSTLSSDMSNVRFVSPDAGALKNVFALNKKFNIPNTVLVANKVRDVKTGNIIRTEVPSYTESMENEHMFIIDDICDGGRTFIEISKELRRNGFKGNLYLVVTHSIFSSGPSFVKEHFDGIFTTNSYTDTKLDGITVLGLY